MSALTRLRAAGFKVMAQGDKVLISPRERLTDELRAWIREHKPTLLAELGQSRDRPSLAATLATGDPASDSDRDRAYREVLAVLERHPHVERAYTTRWEGNALIVSLAVRNVGMCELAIPRERIRDMADYAALLVVLGAPEGRA